MTTPNERCLEIGKCGRLLIEIHGNSIFITLQEVEKHDSSTISIKNEIHVKSHKDEEGFSDLLAVYEALGNSQGCIIKSSKKVQPVDWTKMAG